MHEETRSGRAYLSAVTELLQRIRLAHPTKGLYEAADLQWWWRTGRSTNALDQLFWFDDDGRPGAAAILTEWSTGTALDVMTLPDASPEWVEHVLDRGLAHAAASGIERVELEVARDDEVGRRAFEARGFAIIEDGMAEAWMVPGDLDGVSDLAGGYRLVTRRDTAPRPHHFEKRGGPGDEERLQQTSLYRSDLDLVVLDANDEVAAYGLFWHDPVSSTGMVEPMRTEDAHQGRGLARHVLTVGCTRLFAAGAERIKICFDLSNAAAGHLYQSAGFVPVKQTDIYEGPTRLS